MTSSREFSATGGYTASRLAAGAALTAVGTLLVILRFWVPAAHATLPVGGAVLVAGLLLCATALRRSAVRVQIDPDGVTVLQGDQRQAFRWDEVAELYETELGSTTDLWDFLTGWARGKQHMLTLVDKPGRTLELRNVVEDFPALAALVKRETLTRLLPAAQAACSAGEPLRFGPLTIDRQEVRFGDARLPWAEVESFTDTTWDGAVKVRKRGKFFTWASPPLSDVPNAHVLIAVAQECLRPREEAPALDRGQGTAERSDAAGGGRDPGSS